MDTIKTDSHENLVTILANIIHDEPLKLTELEFCGLGGTAE